MRKHRSKVRGSVETTGILSELTMFVALVALASVHAWTRIEGTLTGYQLSAVQAEQQDLLREQKALELELATRRSARRIESEARAKLGMIEPGPEQIIQVRAGRGARLTEARASR